MLTSLNNDVIMHVNFSSKMSNMDRPRPIMRHNNKHNRQSKASHRNASIIGTIFEVLTNLHSEFVKGFALLNPTSNSCS